MKKSKGLLIDQVEAAQKDIETWPKWMQDAAKFEGGDFSSQDLSATTADRLVRGDDHAEPKQKALKGA